MPHRPHAPTEPVTPAVLLIVALLSVALLSVGLALLLEPRVAPRDRPVPDHTHEPYVQPSPPASPKASEAATPAVPPAPPEPPPRATRRFVQPENPRPSPQPSARSEVPAPPDPSAPSGERRGLLERVLDLLPEVVPSPLGRHTHLGEERRSLYEAPPQGSSRSSLSGCPEAAALGT